MANNIGLTYQTISTERLGEVWQFPHKKDIGNDPSQAEENDHPAEVHPEEEGLLGDALTQVVEALPGVENIITTNRHNAEHLPSSARVSPVTSVPGTMETKGYQEPITSKPCQ